MSERNEDRGRGRRELLRLAGLGAAAGAVAVAAPREPARADEATPAKAGYRETAHVRTYYQLARF